MTQADELKKRTKQFALRIIKMVRALPKSEEAKVIGRQVLRSGTSIGANYRAVCDARSKQEFVSRIAVVLEESNETVHWLELLLESGAFSEHQLHEVLKEANELTAIFGTSLRTAKGINKAI